MGLCRVQKYTEPTVHIQIHRKTRLKNFTHNRARTVDDDDDGPHGTKVGETRFPQPNVESVTGEHLTVTPTLCGRHDYSELSFGGARVWGAKILYERKRERDPKKKKEQSLCVR